MSSAGTKATNERNAEKAQNQATVEEAQEGLVALDQTIDLLDKFYKTMTKNSVNLTLVQGPLDDAPDAGFERGEAYAGAQSEAGGILAMLDVMKSDFMRTVTETEKAEAQAEQDHLEFMTENNKALAQATEAQSQSTDQRDDVVRKYQDTDDRFFQENSKLQGALEELMDLKPVCITTGMGYKDRVSRREEEIASLNKALCILGKYEQFGPDGAGGC